MSSTGARQQACAARAQAGGAAVCAGGRAGGSAAVRRGDGVVAAPAAARVPAVRAQVSGQHQLAGAHGRRHLQPSTIKFVVCCRLSAR